MNFLYYESKFKICCFFFFWGGGGGGGEGTRIFCTKNLNQQ